MTLGLSPAALWLAYADWANHLWGAPRKRQQLAAQAVRKAVRFWTYLAHAAADREEPPCIEPLAQDSRFRGSAWQQRPFRSIYQALL